MEGPRLRVSEQGCSVQQGRWAGVVANWCFQLSLYLCHGPSPRLLELPLVTLPPAAYPHPCSLSPVAAAVAAPGADPWPLQEERLAHNFRHSALRQKPRAAPARSLPESPLPSASSAVQKLHLVTTPLAGQRLLRPEKALNQGQSHPALGLQRWSFQAGIWAARPQSRPRKGVETGRRCRSGVCRRPGQQALRVLGLCHCWAQPLERGKYPYGGWQAASRGQK